ncbi:hypothetical protein GQ457_10G009140 [Hibiscus cannabinus]
MNCSSILDPQIVNLSSRSRTRTRYPALSEIPCVGVFKKILVFDVSFNEITSLQGPSKDSSTIKELYVSKKEVTNMEEIDHLHELQLLELGSNKLRVSF